jgi:hypothetical protein
MMMQFLRFKIFIPGVGVSYYTSVLTSLARRRVARTVASNSEIHFISFTTMMMYYY